MRDCQQRVSRQEYVVCHELVHLRVPEHGKGWQALMGVYLAGGVGVKAIAFEMRPVESVILSRSVAEAKNPVRVKKSTAATRFFVASLLRMTAGKELESKCDCPGVGVAKGRRVCTGRGCGRSGGQRLARSTVKE